jgi:uncharacterized membrane protein YdbT with pleckstrin-like domain
MLMGTPNSVELLEDEEIQSTIRPEWTKWTKSIIFSTFTLTLMIGLFGFLYVWVARRKSRYIVTNRRVIKTQGVLANTTIECFINDIQKVGTAQGVVESIFDHGRIKILTNTDQEIVLCGISKYQKVAGLIVE